MIVTFERKVIRKHVNFLFYIIPQYFTYNDIIAKRNKQINRASQGALEEDIKICDKILTLNKG